MRFVIFTHSLISDWNHGNAHFLRGVVTELLARGHAVEVYEQEDGWSLHHLRAEHGDAPEREFRARFPHLRSTFYDPARLDLNNTLRAADVVIVHEWNDPELVRRIGLHRRRHDYRLLFHDTHHRSASDPAAMAAYDLSDYDAVLAFGRVIRDLYLEHGWARRAYTWHEAADTQVFHPLERKTVGDLVWIGNWGDDERTAELQEFLLDPVRRLGLKARVYGVRYPAAGREALARAGIEYGGWLPNHRAPEVLAEHRLAIHVPRRPYVEKLPGIPTIRVFEALACRRPLLCAPWDDAERLFLPGCDYLIARNGAEMQRLMAELLANPQRAAALAQHGHATVLARHTCAQRVDELLGICNALGAGTTRRDEDPAQDPAVLRTDGMETQP